MRQVADHIQNWSHRILGLPGLKQACEIQKKQLEFAETKRRTWNHFGIKTFKSSPKIGPQAAHSSIRDPNGWDPDYAHALLYKELIYINPFTAQVVFRQVAHVPQHKPEHLPRKFVPGLNQACA